MPDPDQGRRIAGCGCLGLGVALGTLLFLAEVAHQASLHSEAAGWSLFVAFVPVGLYLFIPYIVDRFDPEPWWALAGVFLWGALFATGFSGIVNTLVQAGVTKSAGSEVAGQFVAATFSAPIVEEATKGMAIFGIVVFLRREFDGVVDGIIYGTFAAIGFAAVENVGYYFRFRESLGDVFVIRGILSPWLHPLFTSMTGIGFGLGREHGSSWAKLLFPLMGYVLAVLLHAIWNGSSFFLPDQGALALKLAIGILFALAFMAIVVALVVRKGRTIREYLHDEVALGHISQDECDLICSPFGRLKASLSAGALGRRFIRAGARLALSKWHTARAMKERKGTLSMDFIVPLRHELATLRAQMNARR